MKRRPFWAAMGFCHINSFLFTNRAFSGMLHCFLNVHQAGSEQEVVLEHVAGLQIKIKPRQVVHLR